MSVFGFKFISFILLQKKKNGCCDDVFAFRFFRTLQIQKKAELFDDDDGVKFF